MANDFSTDASCVALWRFESGALTTDSIGSNTLTNVGVAEDTTNYMEGSCCADFERDDTAYLYIEDGDLDSGYPLKEGDATKVISLAFWVKPESDPSSSYRHVIYSNRNDIEDEGFEVGILYNSGAKIYVCSSYVGGSSTWFPATLSAGNKYHVGVAFDGVNKTCLVRIWDDTAETSTSYNETYSKVLYCPGNYDLVIGNSARKISSQGFDGLLDELVVFKALKTASDFDLMASGEYVLTPVSGLSCFFVPMLRMEADTESGEAVCEIPRPQFAGYSLEGPLGTAECKIVRPVIEASGYYTIGTASLAAPKARIEARGGDVTIAQVPLVQITATGLHGTAGVAELRVPRPGLTANSAAASLSMPLAQIVATGLVGTSGLLNARVPLIKTTAEGKGETLGTALLSVPLSRVYGEASRDVFGSAAVRIPLARLSGTALAGTIGSATLTIPIPDLSALGYEDTLGVASITVPLASVFAYAEGAVVVVRVDDTDEDLTGYALVLNMKTNGLTEYDNYPFNSFAYFNGQYLGASAAGLFTLSSEEDLGVKISARARTGLADGGTALTKGVEDAFLGLSTDGTMAVRVVTDGRAVYDGNPVHPRTPDLTTQRVKFGKGIKGRYLGIEIENRAGCDFMLESAELVAIPLTRKL